MGGDDGENLKTRNGDFAESNGEATPQDTELRMLAMVAKSTDNAVIVTDPAGRIEWVNDGFTRITEYSLEEVVGKKPGSFLQSEETDKSTVAEIGRAIAEKRPITTEILNFSKSGRRYWLHINIQPVFGVDGELQKFIAIELDLTERHAAEDRIRMLNKELEEALETKNKFFSIIAHDLRAPFSGLTSMVECLANGIEIFSPEELKDFSARLLVSCRTNLRLMENLLRWARSQMKQLQPNLENLSLTQAVALCCENLKQAAAMKGITIDFDPPGDIQVEADSAMINSAVQNLISNAIKFSQRGGKIEVRIEPGENETYRIRVKDFGVGMHESIAQSLFSPAHTTHARGTEGEGGSGLGLMLVKEFISLHGGEVWCESTPGKGSEFFISLPGAAKKKLAA